MFGSTSSTDSSTCSEVISQLFRSTEYVEALDRALDDTDSREQRKCKLSASFVATLVVAMSLFRHLSIPAVFRELRGWYRVGRRTPRVTDEALLHAKQRLGFEAMQALYENLVGHITIETSFHGLRTYGLDGVKFSVPDTKANEAEFGRWVSSNGATTAFPQVLAVCLIATKTRQVMGLHLDRHDATERPACAGFLERLDSQSLVLMDRGLYAFWLFERFMEQSVHFLCRGYPAYKVRLIERLGRGDYLVELTTRTPVPRAQRRSRLQTHARNRLRLRMIEYKIGRNQRVRLFTDLCDSARYPAKELAQLYHERWECELAFDEIKTHLAGPAQGALQLPFRSHHPDGVRQEAYGLFVAYNLIRTLIAEAAKKTRASPLEISFVSSMHLIRNAAVILALIPAREHSRLIKALLREIADQWLTRTRRNRRCPRTVRVKIVRFPRKRYWHREFAVDQSARLRLVNCVSGFLNAA